jgi:hypothetical protein
MPAASTYDFASKCKEEVEIEIHSIETPILYTNAPRCHSRLSVYLLRPLLFITPRSPRQRLLATHLYRPPIQGGG